MASVFSFSSSSIETNSPKRHIESPAEEESMSKRANVCLHSDDSSAASVFSSSDSSEEQNQSIENYPPINYIKLYAEEESMSASPNVSVCSMDSSMGSLFSSSDISVEQKQVIAKSCPKNHIESYDSESVSKSPNVSLRSNDSSMESLFTSSHLSIEQKRANATFCPKLKNAMKEQFPRPLRAVTRLGTNKSPNVSLRSGDSSMDSFFSCSDLWAEQKQSIRKSSPKNHIKSSDGESVSESPNVSVRSDSSIQCDCEECEHFDYYVFGQSVTSDSFIWARDPFRVNCRKRLRKVWIKVKSIYNWIGRAVTNKSSKKKQ
jgi:hypothetical protein